MNLIGTKEAAKRLGLSVYRVQQMLQRDELKGTKIEGGRSWLIEVGDDGKVDVLVRRPVGRPPKT